jgi:transcription initiation factor IIE alpha subunit
MSKSKEEIGEILEYVIKRIDKRIPKKPNVSIIYECPSCASPYDVDYDGQYDYCPKCGQLIDWR